MRVLSVLAVLGLAATMALADWNPGDPHKMHFPQLPDPNGWDVEFCAWPGPAWWRCQVVADDWQCSETGPVSDIHLWTSWMADELGVFQTVEVMILDNDLSDPNFSKPGEILWSRSFDTYDEVSPYGTGDQGFYTPLNDEWELHDHQQYQQINLVDIQDPFIQQQDEIYWLAIWVTYPTTQNPCGWKTSPDHFQDAAVWWEWGDTQEEGAWHPLADPVTGATLDLAFVITPEPAALGLMLVAFGLSRRR